MVAVEGLVVVVLHEHRPLVGFQQRGVVDVGVGVVDKGAGLDVAVGVDVQIIPASGDAALDVFPVVPEVHGEQRLGVPEPANLVVHELPLLGGGHQIGGGPGAHRHVGEEPGEQRALGDEVVEILLAADDVHVLAGVAAGRAEGQTPAFEDLHGPGHGLIGALAPAEVGFLLEALHADGRDKVLYPQHVVGKGLVDERGVGEGQEHAVRVGLAEADDVILADQRLTAGIDVHEGAHGGALPDDRVQGVVVHVQLVAVLRRPAAGAVEVAGGGGVHQDGPRHVAAVLLLGLVLTLAANGGGVENEVLEKLAADAGVDLGPNLLDEVVPVSLLAVHDLAEDCALTGDLTLLVEPIHPVHSLLNGVVHVLRIVEIVQDPFDGEGLHMLYEISVAHIRHSFLQSKWF